MLKPTGSLVASEMFFSFVAHLVKPLFFYNQKKDYVFFKEKSNYPGK